MTGPQGELAGASCTAATCTAVGSSTNSSGTGVPLVEVRKGTKWAIQTTPSPAGALSAGLAGVSCTGASACTAVGDYTNSSGTEVTLAEVRKGTTWAIQKTPNPTGSKGSSLSAVSCTGASACTAVGDYVKTNGSGVTAGTVETLAEVWNGTNWKVQPTPNHAGGNSLFGRNNSLFGVSCTRASACTAVGSYLSSTDSDEMLVEVWNGTNWKIQAIPNPAGSGYNDLAAVSCTGSTACTAVGETFQGSSGQGPLAEVRNGTSWKVQTTPSPTGEQFSKLTGVSCSGASACTAVGSATNISGTQGMFTEVRKSTSWKIQATASPPGAKSSSLTGVSCSAASACTAAGGDGDRTNSPYLTLAEVWNGSSWKIQATSNGNGAQPSNLAGVSCIGLSTCTAVGDGTNNRGAQVTLAEVWNGANWKIHATATPTGAQSAGLAGVSCTSPSRCIAVGDYTNSGGREVTLAEAWNGSSWKIQTTRNPTGAQSAGLSGVSCTAATCTAVGNYVSSGGTELTLVEVWNGTGWTIRPTADPADAQAARLSAVSCTRASSCIAVGSYIITDSSGKEVTLAEVWNGANWKIEATPNPTDTEIDLLSGVSCTATSACIAVGSADGGRLAEVLKGTSWKLQAIPSPAGAQASSLSGISCSAVSACITVGNYTNIGGVELTLAEVWNGADWKVQPSLDPGGAPQSYLSGVSCFRASVCTAVGGYNPVDSTVGVTLAEGYF